MVGNCSRIGVNMFGNYFLFRARRPYEFDAVVWFARAFYLSIGIVGLTIATMWRMLCI